MPTIMPKDAENISIPALRLKSGGAHNISVTGVSATNPEAFSADTRIISLYATGPVYVNLGGSTVTATSGDHYIPPGIYLDIAIGGGKTGHCTHIATLRASQDCQLFISERE